MDVGRRGLLAGFAAYACWGLFPLYFHHTAPASAGEVLFHRMVQTLLVMALLITVRRIWPQVRPVLSNRAVLGRVVLAAAMISTNWSLYIWAIGNDRVVDAALGYFINPLVTVALGVVLLGERLRQLQRGALVLGALAVAVLTAAYGNVPWVALVLALSFAVYSFLKKGVALDPMVSLFVETVVLLPVALVGFGVLWSRHQLEVGSNGPGHTILIAFAGVVTAVPLVLFGAAARAISLSQLGLLQYLTPTMQMLCGVLVFGESVPAVRWVGFAIVWCALGLLVTDAVRSHRADRNEVSSGPPLIPSGRVSTS
jgi:chloramphenicol-sensitive protein RarD